MRRNTAKQFKKLSSLFSNINKSEMRHNCMVYYDF